MKAMNGEATALNDSFTKEFIAEEWVEDEFHLFESKTGQYRMLFPDQFQMISDPPEYYGRRGNGFEIWSALIYDETNDGISYEFRVMFRESEADLSRTRLNIMLESHSYQNQYEELETNETLIYHGSSFWDSSDPSGDKKDPSKFDANRFFGLVLDPKANRSVEFVYSTVCYKEELGCELNPAQQYELALNLMKSIKFLD
ncbi:hypothetical protein RYX56_17180 [Alkalihalophilus lindianensis]|uniref:Uncharacterized protein n=1 Tax=Alkalihalophilus lindianensis TaxID=1630542 RepID=A0ABU3XDZ6_9BACI|nr:hypothetical protein [Alkalihalophilus lindianensis]MDV2686104.1 hypothetical protein [Alkalihalophilus lindianensis]